VASAFAMLCAYMQGSYVRLWQSIDAHNAHSDRQCAVCTENLPSCRCWTACRDVWDLVSHASMHVCYHIVRITQHTAPGTPHAQILAAATEVFRGVITTRDCTWSLIAKKASAHCGTPHGNAMAAPTGPAAAAAAHLEPWGNSQQAGTPPPHSGCPGRSQMYMYIRLISRCGARR
jgi:hypothetical protein